MAKKTTKKKNVKSNKKTTKKVVEKKIKEEKIENLYEDKKSFFQDNFTTNLLFVTLTLFIIEILFRAISNFAIFDYATFRILLSTTIISSIVVFISTLFKRKWLKNTIILTFIFIYSLYAWLQLGFYNFLGVYISFHTTSQIGAVIDYLNDFILSYKLIYYCIFLPFIFAIVYYILMRKRGYTKIKFKLIPTIISILAVVFLCTTYYLTLILGFMQNDLQLRKNIKLFANPDIPTIAVNQFGSTVFGLIDLKSYVFPNKKEETEVVITLEKPEEPKKMNREVLPVIDELANTETDTTFNNLNRYFSSQKVKDFNDYTGKFKDKNVVVILIESGSDALINEESFPSFYKLYSEGWSWTNHYSPRNSCATGNNEFSTLTSLYSIYNTCTMNTYENNKYFESIFNLFNKAGYNTTSMHNYDETYYYRNVSHLNMGSGKYYNYQDLGMALDRKYGEWTSDEEFFDKAFDIILNNDSNKPWFTFLTTVTGHQPYNSSTIFGDLYKPYFITQGYSQTASRYLSKLKVFDDALKLMLNKLEAANELDDTVIVMLADHYPYGLNYSTYKEVAQHEFRDLDIEKTPFVIYNREMEGQVFEDYTSYINLLPTLANLLGLDYDPRLYMGDDLLSEDYESLVIFADGSWKNEIAYYRASSGSISYYGETQYSLEEIQRINEMVNLKIAMSSSAIKNNYFSYLETKISEYENNSKKTNEVALSKGD